MSREYVERRHPEMDFLTAEETGLIGLPDPEVLRLTAQLNCILVSHDERTMPGHFRVFLETHATPGVFIIPQRTSLAEAIEGLQLIWAASEAEEWSNRLVWIPL